jgi:hypothetical protein
MNNIHIIFKVIYSNIWARGILFGTFGALIGFAYYAIIGCYGGSCPITGSPYIMTGYGAIAGVLLTLKR